MAHIRMRSIFKFVRSFVSLNENNINARRKSYHIFALLKRNVYTSGTISFILGTTTGAAVGFSLLTKQHALSAAENEAGGMSRREARFHQFASCEYNGHVVMTPHDFIESLIEEKPKITRRAKILLMEKDVENMRKSTPGISKGSDKFFRSLDQNGIIRYSEYLFLVTILTKSNNGLKIALKMMDINGDQEIAADEFHKIAEMFDKSAASIPKDYLQHTTLLCHLFGRKADQVVSFEKFFKFMDDLQSEVLELEFNEYSKSMNRISEVDFARILLRNTTLTQTEYHEYLNRLETCILHPKGISMEEFKSFHKFLSNLEDFSIAINMTNMLNEPVDQEFFSRAIQVSTGERIHPCVIDVVFKLFDKDGDGKLSQNEFVGIMKDRLKRGFGKFPNMKGFDGFKRCVKKEMIKPAD